MISPEQRKGLRTWIEVDTSAIRKNYETFRGLISPACKMMSIVKSNAYGHSLVDFSKTIEEIGADWLGVDSVMEGLALRREGITIPILVLGFTLPEKFAEAAENDLSLTLSNAAFFEFLKEEILRTVLKKKLKVHVKVDTGMHRQGFLPHEKEMLSAKLKEFEERLEVQGLYTHFSAAKKPSSPDYTKHQIEEFTLWRELFKRDGRTIIAHASATAGTILFPEAQYDMVRIGAGLYGIWPSSEVETALKEKLTLIPALSWKTLIGEMKKLPKGEHVGYDLTATLERDSTIAVCPVGYWHGFPRALSNIGRVLVKGKMCKVLGRVSMDMIVIDVTDVPAPALLDEVVIIGKSENAELTLNDFANGASHYEAITRINPLIKKIFF